MNKITKTIIYLTIILSFLLMPLQNAEAARINTTPITSKVTYVGGYISGTAEICLRGPGNAFSYYPNITISRWYSDGSTSFIKHAKLSPGKCTSFNSGSYGHKVYHVSVSRVPSSNKYSFDLNN